MKLWAIYIGGTINGAMIELHDMRFAVADNIEDTYDDLRASWWGKPESLHLDCWGVLDHADGHDIQLKPEPYTGPEKLYFANLGGYSPDEFTELHSNIFVVAPDLPHARARALETIKSWQDGHRDYIHEIENIVDISTMLQSKGLHIHLCPGPHKAFCFEHEYRKIGVK